LNFAMSLSNLSATGEGGVNLALPYLRAVKASGSLVSGNNPNFGTFDSVSGSMAGQFSLAGGFTPVVSGIYYITGTFECNAGAPSAGSLILEIAQGSNIIEIQESGYVGGHITATVSGLIQLTAGVATILSVYQTLGSPLAVANITFTAVLITAF
jgi:hypothetical protein